MDPAPRAIGAAAPTPATLGQLLRAWRERSRLSQEALAERAGLAVGTVRRIERLGAAGRPRGNSINMLAAALDLSKFERSVLIEAATTPGTPVRPRAPSARPDVGTCTGLTVPRQLPAGPTSFTGRSGELAELLALRGSGSVVVVGIHGMAGIGKSALAVTAAHRMASEYPDGQLYLDMHAYTDDMCPIRPSDALERMLRSLGVHGDRIPVDLDDRAALFRDRLAGGRTLILLDNALDAAQVTPLLPGTGDSMVLITSRQRMADLDFHRHLFLEVLPPPDAVALFERVAGGERLHGATASQVSEIVELCGRLPLAIRIAAARLQSRPAWDCAELIARFHALGDRLHDLRVGERTVAAALDLSCRQLSNSARRAYHLLGLHPGADVGIWSAAALFGRDIAQARLILDDLLDSHLLEEHVRGRYRFHDLVRAHAVGSASEAETEAERRAAVSRLLAHYQAATSHAMSLIYPFERHGPLPPPTSVAVPQLDNAAQAREWLDTEIPNIVTAAQIANHEWPDFVLHLSTTLEQHLRIRGWHAEALLLHEQALGVARATANCAGVRDALTALGLVHLHQHRLTEAEVCHRRALSLAVATGNTAAELTASANVAHVHLARGRYDRAGQQFRRTLKLSLVEADRTSELEALLGIGWVNLSQGRDAKEEFDQALVIAREIGHESGQVHVFRGLGHVHRLRGEHELAAEYFALSMSRARAFGSATQEEQAMASLASVERILGRSEDAVDRYQQLLTRAEAEDKPALELTAAQGLGRLHLADGRPAVGRGYHQRAIVVARRLGARAQLAGAHDGLARCLLALGQHDDARTHWQRAIELLEELGANRTREPQLVTAEDIRERLALLDQSDNAM